MESSVKVPAAFAVKEEGKHDGCLVVEGKRLWVNSGFISMHSPVLARKFQAALGKEVWLGGKALGDVLELLHCLVPTPSVREVDELNVNRVVHLAHEWDIRFLFDKCQKVVSDAVDRQIHQAKVPAHTALSPAPTTPLLPPAPPTTPDALGTQVLSTRFQGDSSPPVPVWNQQMSKDAALRAVSATNAHRGSGGQFSHLYDKPLPKYLTQPWHQDSPYPLSGAYRDHRGEGLLQRPAPRRLGPMVGPVGPVGPVGGGLGGLGGGGLGYRAPAAPSPLAVSLGPNGAPSKASPLTVLAQFGSFGAEPGQFNSPHGFCLNPTDNSIAVADTNNHRIQIFELSGLFREEFGVAGKEEGCLWYPRKVVVNPFRDDEFIVCDRGNERSRMQLFDRRGHFVKKIPIRFVDIVAGLAVDPKGHIVIVDSVSPSLFVVCPEQAELIQMVDISGEMKEPSDVACFRDEYFICDFKGHAVCVFSTAGDFRRRVCLDAFTSFPNGVDVSADGDLVVGDSHGNRLHLTVFRPNGTFLAEFDSAALKVSRCCGLRMTSSGHLVTLAKNNHQIIVVDTLTVPEASSVLRQAPAQAHRLPAALSSLRTKTLDAQPFSSPLLSALRRTPLNPNRHNRLPHSLLLPTPPDS